MFTRVLVPLDGSQVAEGILPYVTQFAKRMNAGVVLHTSVDPASIYVSTMYGPQQESRTDPGVDAASEGHVEADILRDIESDLNVVARGLADQGIETDVVATLGQPVEQILTTAEVEKCDLIALATHGRSAVGRGLLGSVTDRVVHLSTLPVLTISPARAEKRPDSEYQIRNVIVPMDGSELGESSLPAVEGLAVAMSLQVHLVLAFDLVEHDWRHRYELALAGIGSSPEQLKAHHKEYLDSVAEGLVSRGLDVKTEVLMGPTKPAILEYARESPQDIIVMATHGRSGFRRLLLGSVTEAMVRSSSVPVLIIPPTLPT